MFTDLLCASVRARERAMALSAMAWTAMILVVVFLSLTFAPNWSLAILILVGKIAQHFGITGKKTAEPPSGHSPGGTSDSGSGDGPGGDDAPPAPRPPTHVPSTSVSVPPDPSRLAIKIEEPAADASTSAVYAAGPGLPSTSSSSYAFKYDVYLNFRDTDTRTTIMNHLFKALADVGISIFKEEYEKLEQTEPSKEFEETIGEKEFEEMRMTEAIEQSRISIAILSTDYASSKWCLMQLVQMWECRQSEGHIIIPIFYDVSPSDVRHQAGDFGQAFSLHEKEADSETIKNWREVLGHIAALPGYSGKLYEGYENQLAETVVLRVARILRDDGLAVTDKLFGIDLHVQEIMRKLGVAHSEGRQTEVRGEDVRVIGICGEPGVGKTTLAKVIYNEVRTLFEAYSFLEGISVRGVRASQQLLIADLLNLEPAPLESVDEGIKKIASLFRNKKVLIVLDNVDGDEQIKALAGELTWFGSESRIIVTTRSSQVLSAFDVGANGRGTVEEHKIEPMSPDDALQLFRYHALERGEQSVRTFGWRYPYEWVWYSRDVDHFEPISEKIVKAIGGVPKDIVHHASDLGRRRSLIDWEYTLEELQKLKETGRQPESVMQEDQSLKIPSKTSKPIITEDSDTD